MIAVVQSTTNYNLTISNAMPKKLHRLPAIMKLKQVYGLLSVQEKEELRQELELELGIPSTTWYHYLRNDSVPVYLKQPIVNVLNRKLLAIGYRYDLV